MMYPSLSAGAIGVRDASLERSLELAKIGGFEGLDFSVVEVKSLADAHGVDYVKDLFTKANIRPGGWGLPTNWRADEAALQEGLEALPSLAKVAKAIGSERCFTWMTPGSDERPFAWNLDWHIRRFRPIAQALADEGCRFGIEFIGPKTSRAKRKFEFIYTMEGLLELAKAIGTGNVGLLLDAWHLYTSGGNADQVRKIKNSDVVFVHVNDAPVGIEREEQIDNVRALPMETGVIDLPAFMKALQSIGYDGPVTPEPFSKTINALSPEEAMKMAGESMRKLFASASL